MSYCVAMPCLHRFPTGTDVGHHSAAQHALRELGRHVFDWLAAVSPAIEQQALQQLQTPTHAYAHANQQQTGSGGAGGTQPLSAGAGAGSGVPAPGMPTVRELLAVVRCTAAWVRVGCLHAAAPPSSCSVERLLGLLLRLAVASPTGAASEVGSRFRFPSQARVPSFRLL